MGAKAAGFRFPPRRTGDLAVFLPGVPEEVALMVTSGLGTGTGIVGLLSRVPSRQL